MQFKTLLSAAALLVPSWAIIQITNFPMPTAIQTGQVYTITWTGATPGLPVTLRLRQGDPGNLSVVGTITTSATGDSYAWTPDTMIVTNSNYALEISQPNGDVNYSKQFAIQGTSVASASGSVTSALASASSRVSSASSAISSLSSALSSISSVASRNATMTSSASSTVATSTRASTTSASSTGAPTSGNSGNNLQSPIALILGAFAAMMYFN